MGMKQEKQVEILLGMTEITIKNTEESLKKIERNGYQYLDSGLLDLRLGFCTSHLENLKNLQAEGLAGEQKVCVQKSILKLEDLVEEIKIKQKDEVQYDLKNKDVIKALGDEMLAAGKSELVKNHQISDNNNVFK